MRRFDHETVNRGYSEYSEMVPTAEGDYVLYDDAANWKARAEKAEADRAELLEALLAILPWIPTTSANEGGASKYSENVRAADKVRAAIARAMGEGNEPAL